MKTLYLIGDEYSSLAIPVRISETPETSDGEKLWAALSIDHPHDLLRRIGSRLRAPIRTEAPCNESAQRVIEAARLLLDDGELSGCEFRLEMFDYHTPGTVTIFARSATPAQSMPRTEV